MRVISGIARGRRLKPPKGLKIRPTADRVKEALFNIIRDRVKDSIFLDLFAGTGNIGIEALSRGAARVVFVEYHYRTLQLIRSNLELTGFVGFAELVQGNVPLCFEHLKRLENGYHLIFLDPPYLKNLITPTLEGISKYNFLIQGGLVIVESSKLENVPQKIDNLQLQRQEKYGDTCLSFYCERYK
ncbi:16S rRNA (guanine(966)-N(2))-methyltransferase RsmD [Desulfolucanica intricata]|uniref:16S rRNA (guanine(966)-N(2))-methyltransferase RsmD n=1 Tax=Desulfolucanica intricata TaxID=1285191 RepID=UPI000836703B|nr:16S rRNA (guanine(966)-N(2))-methyltransferase RsmD [Desulfolucanica intricata]